MGKKYAAFISYRHLPTDMKVAGKLHKMIERYVIPRDLCTSKGKRLGVVFRDKDELPLTSDLNSSIISALDNSEYLIVVCTPETPKSEWVQLEIEHFISVHGRSRVFVVLAEGTMQESVPEQIINVYAEDGTVIDQIEPLAAHIADKSSSRVMKNLRREFLRLVAGMLGVSYDSLYQRNKRYQMRRMVAFMMCMIVLGAAFIGTLFVKNRELSQKNNEIAQKNQQIHEQLLATQRSESYSMAQLSLQALEEGNRNDAIRTSMAALPSAGNDRAFCPDAQYALTKALHIYEQNGIYPVGHIYQGTQIDHIAVSANGRYAVTFDVYGTLRGFDLHMLKQVWENVVGTSMKDALRCPDQNDLRWFPSAIRDQFEHGNLLLLTNAGLLRCVDASTGDFLAEITYDGLQKVVDSAANPDTEIAAGDKSDNTVIDRDDPMAADAAPSQPGGSSAWDALVEQLSSDAWNHCIAGPDNDENVLCWVPWDNWHQISVLQFVELPHQTIAGDISTTGAFAHEDDDRITLYRKITAEDKKRSYDLPRQYVTVEIPSLQETLSPVYTREYSQEGFWYLEDISPDGTWLNTGTRILDFSSGAEKPLSSSCKGLLDAPRYFEMLPRGYDTARNPSMYALTCSHGDSGHFHLWIDGKEIKSAPFDSQMGYPDEYTIGAGGLVVFPCSQVFYGDPARYIIYSIEDQTWKTCPVIQMTRNTVPATYEVCETKKQFVYADYDSQLHLYDFDLGEEVKTFPLPIHVECIGFMQFVLEDQVLLMLDVSHSNLHTYDLYAIDMSSGDILFTHTFDGEAMAQPWKIFARVDETTNSLYLCEPAGKITGLRIDMENWGLLAEIEGLVDVVASGQYVICYIDHTIVVYPVYSLEALMAWGDELIN